MVAHDPTHGGADIIPFGAEDSPTEKPVKEEPMPITIDDTSSNIVTIKEEEDAGDCNTGNNGGSSSSSSLSVDVLMPKPMEGIHENGPPPFLKKTFEMMEDPDTNSIVSWSNNRESFVVWDVHEFSKHLLPKYFKHSNFSSFIRQLNTYGFRKIDPDRWEFANEAFKGGKKHLLKNIKRRSRYNNRLHQRSGGGGGCDFAKLTLEAEVESLKSDQDLLKLELVKLRQQQKDSDNQLSSVEQRIRYAECKQLQMFIFLAKATKNPCFIQNLMKKRKQHREFDGSEFIKKRRLLENEAAETHVPENLPDASQSINCRNQAREQLATMQTEITEILKDNAETNTMPKLFAGPLVDEFCSDLDIVEDNKANVICGTNCAESAYDLMSEKLLDDGDGELDVNDSKFYLELEDLIGKPRSWGGGFVGHELVEHASCV